MMIKRNGENNVPPLLSLTPPLQENPYVQGFIPSENPVYL
jgi:hypothetical protein